MIYNMKLYIHAGFRSFNAYFKDEETKRTWDMSRARAHQLISAYSLVQYLPLEGGLPPCDSVLRPLMKCKVTDLSDIWSRILRVCREEGCDITERLVREYATPAWQKGGSTTELWLTSESDKWYMSDELLQACLEVLVHIELDVGSDAVAAKRVGADEYIDEEKDAIDPETLWTVSEEHERHGMPVNMLCNAPGGEDRTRRTKDGSCSIQGLFLEKAIEETKAGRVNAMVLHLRAAVGQKWFKNVYTIPHCFLRERIQFVNPSREDLDKHQRNPHGSVICFLGNDQQAYRRWLDVFSKLGYIPGYAGAWSAQSDR